MATIDQTSEIRIGLRLRHARLGRGLLLRELAALAGCSESMLSKVENDRVVPSLSVLRRVTEVLDLTIGELFSRTHDVGRIVYRVGERPVVAIDPLRSGSGILMERLIPHAPEHMLQGSIHIVEPGGGSDGMITHDGEEVGYVIEGTLELTVGDEVFALETGDSFVFRSETPHGYRNTGPVRARVIFINTPPTF